MLTENEVVLAIDNVRSMLGELKSMAHNYAELKRSRDRWKTFAEERESKLNMIETELDARWVKLPIDAEGVPIHVGDELETSGGEDGTCVSIECSRNGRWSVSVRPRGWDTPTVYDQLEVIHAKEQRTVEDVLSDFADDVIRCCDDREKLAAAAAEIRELLGVDDEE